ncbi:LysR substrate-binding domain-containing protein, partial [Actinosynnema sp. NPDC023658]|uniref:LysR substrate-binding domain-containing protein n=1 Tax=Actinosynnema sp. NPDC023658 TaxID=3155465 RepID=UPI0033C27BBE
LGWSTSAGAVLVPRANAALSRKHPTITVTSREGGTPALVKALRAGTVDLAELATAPPFRPFDAESPALRVMTLVERSLRVAVPSTHPLAARAAVTQEDLLGQRWIAGTGAHELGVWPGLAERPSTAHTARDWLAKLSLVAAGAGITTVPATFTAAVPPGVRVLQVVDSTEQRRVVLARLPGPVPGPVDALVQVFHAVAADLTE